MTQDGPALKATLRDRMLSLEAEELTAAVEHDALRERCAA